MIIGKNVGINYGGETTYGTAVSATTSIGIEASINPSVRKTVLPVFGIGAGSNFSQAVALALDYTGTLSSNFADPTFLKHSVGVLSGGGTNISSDPKVLTEAEEYSVSASSGIQAMTMKVKKNDASSDQMDTYAGCYLTDWTISGAEEQVVLMNSSFVAKSLVAGTTIDNAYTELSTVPYIGAQSQLLYGDTPSSVANVVSWSVTMANRNAIYRGIANSDLTISQPVKSYRDYRGTITIRASNALVATMIADVNSASTLPITRELKILMAESASPADTDKQAIVWLDQVHLSDYSESIQVSDEVVQITFNFVAKKGKDSIPIRWTD